MVDYPARDHPRQDKPQVFSPCTALLAGPVGPQAVEHHILVQLSMQAAERFAQRFHDPNVLLSWVEANPWLMINVDINWLIDGW